MARTRSIKPAFFKNEILSFLPANDKLTFIGLWTLADRAGRLEDRPTRIKGELFPYFDMDVEAALCRLDQTGFIHRYESGGERYIAIPTFGKHQSPHLKEQASTIPAPDMHQALSKSLINNGDGHAPDMHGVSTSVAAPSTLIPSTLQSVHPSDATDYEQQFANYVLAGKVTNVPPELTAKICAKAVVYSVPASRAAAVFLDVYYRAHKQRVTGDGIGYLLTSFENEIKPKPVQVVRNVEQLAERKRL